MRIAQQNCGGRISEVTGQIAEVKPKNPVMLSED
jgi:hypothetical protein